MLRGPRRATRQVTAVDELFGTHRGVGVASGWELRFSGSDHDDFRRSRWWQRGTEDTAELRNTVVFSTTVIRLFPEMLNC